jgi:hypothetical protein
MEGFFVEQTHARVLKTSVGPLDTVLFIEAIPAIRVCASQRDGRYLYEVTTNLTHRVIDANRPLFFAGYANAFIETDDQTTNNSLRDKLQSVSFGC